MKSSWSNEKMKQRTAARKRTAGSIMKMEGWRTVRW